MHSSICRQNLSLHMFHGFFFRKSSCLYSLFSSDSSLESQGFFLDDRSEDENGNEVWNRHQCIGNIRQVPYEIQRLGGADEYDKRESDTVDDIEAVGTEEVFPCFFPIVFPAEDGGESKEDDADGNDVAAYSAQMGGESGHGKFYAGERLAVSAQGTEDIGRSNGQAGDGAYYDGIDEGTGHRDVSLTGWMIGGRSSCGNRCRTKACFIGETSSCYAEADRIHHGDGDGAHDAPFYSLRVDGHHKDEIEAVRNIFIVDGNAEDACQDIECSHAWYDDGSHSCDGADAADNYCKGENGKNDAHDGGIKSEGSIHSGGNRIRLSHVADAERSDDREESEEGAHEKAGSSVGETILHGEHGAAFHLAFRIHFSVLETKEAFREFSGKAEACRDPHPYESPRTAGKHGGSNTYYISCTDSCRKSRHKCRERRNISTSRFRGTCFLSKYILQCVGKISPCEETEIQCHKDTGAKEQHEHHRSPYKTVNPAHKLVQFIHCHNNNPPIPVTKQKTPQ